VNIFGNMFEKAVARGRKVSLEVVHSKFGQGRVFDAKTALRLGLGDRIATLDEVLQGYGVARQGSGISGQRSGASFAAAAEDEGFAEANGLEVVANDSDGGGETVANAGKMRRAMERRRLEMVSV